jgi:hypothetical protein
MNESNEQLAITALFPNGQRETYNISRSSSVRNLIKFIKTDDSVPKPDGKKITILYHGKILNKDFILSEIEKLPSFTVHVFFRQPQIESSQVEDNLSLCGFERLRRMGYNSNQIQEARINFHRMHHSLDLSTEEQIAIEEEWFPLILNQNNPNEIIRPPMELINVEIRRNYSDVCCRRFFFGCLCGYFFGMGSILLFLFDPNDRAFPLGICVGIFVGVCCDHKSKKRF